jgi:hypothetical protein
VVSLIIPLSIIYRIVPDFSVAKEIGRNSDLL